MTTTAEPAVLTRIDGDVAYVSLNRPDKLNGVTFDVLQGLLDAAADLRRRTDLRAIVLQGEGRSFCAGLDFASVKGRGRIAQFFIAWPWRATNRFQEAFWAWRTMPVPVIAVTRGHVFGAGIQLALAADFRFTTPDAKWSVLEAKWGLVPDMSGTVPLSELLPADVAKRLVLTGEIVSGERAAAIGLATEAAPDPMVPALELVEALRERSPDSVAASKRLMNLVQRGGVRAAFRRERRYQLAMFRTRNHRISRRAGASGEKPAFGPRTFG
jgi:enoyl-CoA hydratase/carnithine racemase